MKRDRARLGALRIRNYVRMLAARGPRYPWDFFWQVHWFDIRHRTDTASALPKSEYMEAPATFDHGVEYMCSWTSEVDYWFDYLTQRLGADFAAYSFVDVGCGKGKVLLEWTEELTKAGIRQEVLGIEYYAPLAEVASTNFATCFPGKQNPIVIADALTFDYAQLGGRLIVYLFNPFDAAILTGVVDALRNEEVLLLYNNPVFHEVVEQCGFARVHETSSYHPCGVTYLYSRVPLPSEK